MPYITLPQLAELPGAEEFAQVATNDHQPTVDTALMDATLRGADRSAYAAADVAVADDAASRIADTIAETDQLIDGYLAIRYTLPLGLVPGILSDWARKIVRYKLHRHLHGDAKSHPIIRDYYDALRFLEQIRDGKITFGAQDPNAVKPDGDSSAQGIEIHSDDKQFGRPRRW